MSSTLLIRRDPNRAYGFTFDTDPDGTVFVWVGHQSQLTDDLLHAINDAYQLHIAALLSAHRHHPGPQPPATSPWPWTRTNARPIAPRTPPDDAPAPTD